MGKGYLEVSFF